VSETFDNKSERKNEGKRRREAWSDVFVALAIYDTNCTSTIFLFDMLKQECGGMK
jgi:hypothetical protein